MCLASLSCRQVMQLLYILPVLLQGTILPGITRMSILELAAARGYIAEEVPVSLKEALEADEVFTSGTAVSVTPVGSLTHKSRKTQYGKPGVPGDDWPCHMSLMVACCLKLHVQKLCSKRSIAFVALCASLCCITSQQGGQCCQDLLCEIMTPQPCAILV